MLGLKDLLAIIEGVGATQYYQAPPFGALLTLTTSTPQTIRYTRPGWVYGIMGQTDAGTAASYAGTTLRVQIGGTEDLFIDGQGGPAFSPFLALFGGTPNAQRCLRRVGDGVLWTFTVANGTAGTVTPTVVTSFISDADVQASLDTMARLRAGRG